MSRLRTTLAAGIGIATGAYLVRRLRERRRTPDAREEAETAAEEAFDEASTAAEHAVAAAGHARTAGRKGIEYLREEFDERDVLDERDVRVPARVEQFPPVRRESVEAEETPAESNGSRLSRSASRVRGVGERLKVR